MGTKRKINGYTVEWLEATFNSCNGGIASICENGDLSYSKNGVLTAADFENVCELVKGLDRGSEA